MKKIFTSICIGVAALGAMAAEGKMHYAEKILTASDWDQYMFTYNEQNLLSSYVHIDMSTDETGIPATNVRLFTYNSDGKVVREEQWQDVYDKGYDENFRDNFMLANWLEYKYNSKGEMIEWRPFNWDDKSSIWDPEYINNAVVRFEYDEIGLLTTKQIYRINSAGVETLAQKEEYLYDSDNLLSRVDIFQYAYGNEYKQTMMFKYDDDELYQIVKYSIDPYDGSLAPSGYIDYAYTAQGDLEAVQTYGASRAQVLGEERYYYEEDFPLSETVLPINWYDTNYNINPHYLTLIKKPVTRYETYELEEVSGKLAKSDTYNVYYTTERPVLTDSGVATPVVPGYGNMMVQSISGGKLTMSGIHSFDDVRIFDADGRIVKECLYGSGIDMSSLPAGAYMVTSAAGVAKVIK